MIYTSVVLVFESRTELRVSLAVRTAKHFQVVKRFDRYSRFQLSNISTATGNTLSYVNKQTLILLMRYCVPLSLYL